GGAGRDGGRAATGPVRVPGRAAARGLAVPRPADLSARGSAVCHSQAAGQVRPDTLSPGHGSVGGLRSSPRRRAGGGPRSVAAVGRPAGTTWPGPLLPEYPRACLAVSAARPTGPETRMAPHPPPSAPPTARPAPVH